MSELLHFFAWFMWVGGAITGIEAGKIFKLFGEEKFSFGMAAAVWLSYLFFGACCYWMAELTDNQEEQTKAMEKQTEVLEKLLDRMNQVDERISQAAEAKAAASISPPSPSEPAPAQNPLPQSAGEPVYPIDVSRDLIECPVCRSRQQRERTSCYNCGVKFTDKKP